MLFLYLPHQNGMVNCQKIRGKNGFGYDPIFIDLKSGLSAAEISLEKKNSISHRYRSLKKLEKKIYKLNLNE